MLFKLYLLEICYRLVLILLVIGYMKHCVQDSQLILDSFFFNFIFILITELFVKPTNLQLFLSYDSNHPTHCKDAIVYSQALRVIERCSQPGSVEPHLDNLKENSLQESILKM